MRPILADAVDLARRALLELEPSGVGAHLGVIAEDESAATHRFEATLPGYRGWQWAVVVAAPPGAGYATVSESALLPGPDALVAPEFVPWEQRVRPGDLAPGDLLAPPADDPRLVPGYVATGDPVVDEVAYEVGLGRTKVMSREGREEAAERWYAERGPDSEMAKAAPATCGSCGFYLPLAGSLRAAFGVCGNAMGADGRVVHVAYGCGAHSDTEVPTGNGSPLYEAYDDAAIDLISLENDQAAPNAAGAPTSADDRLGTAEQTEDATATGASVGDAAAAERPLPEDVVVADTAVVPAAVAAPDAIRGSRTTEEPAVTERVAADEGVGSTENGAVADELTVESPSATDAQPADSTATDTDAVSAAEVGEIDTSAAFSESSVPPAARTAPSADAPAVHDSTSDAGAAATVGAPDEQRVSTQDTGIDPEMGSGDAADTPAAAGESDSSIPDRTAPLDTQSPASYPVEVGAQASPVEVDSIAHEPSLSASPDAEAASSETGSGADEGQGAVPPVSGGSKSAYVSRDPGKSAGEASATGFTAAELLGPDVAAEEQEPNHLDARSDAPEIAPNAAGSTPAVESPEQPSSGSHTDRTGDTASTAPEPNVEERSSDYLPGGATDAPVAEPGDTGSTVDDGPGERSEYQSSPRS